MIATTINRAGVPASAQIVERLAGATPIAGKIGEEFLPATPPTIDTPAATYVVTPTSATPVVGDKEKFFVTPSASCELTLAAGVVIPSDSGFTGTKTLTADLLYIVQLEYSGTFWMLESLVGGYAQPA